jgi:integrase/recombinase XerD
MKAFESFLAPQLNRFIAYRHDLGYAAKPIRSYLLRFDRYLKEHTRTPAVLQPSFFLELRSQLKGEPMTINRLLSSVRGFFSFLVRTEYYTENPLTDIPPVPERSFVPFLFSPEQTDHLLAAACNRIRKEPRYYLKDLSAYMAVVLMARCGLRINEPLRLQLHQYRCRERTIYIEKTKFSKDRLIPIPESVAAGLDNYLSVRAALMAEDHNPYVFVGHNQKAVGDHRLRFVFHRAVRDIGIDRPRQVIGHMVFASPTPHSLRHSFAVNTLKRVQERGDCPQHALPVLAAYMGHSIYHYTATYLKFIDAEQRQGVFDFAMSRNVDL